MYVSKDNWSEQLRQGDVVGPIRFPNYTANMTVPAQLSSLSMSAESGELQNRIIVDSKSYKVVVLSHCCEFNDDKRDRLLVAPIWPAPADKVDSLRENNDVIRRLSQDGVDTVGWVNSFLYEEAAGVFDRPNAVRFEQMVSLPKAWHDDFMADKQVEITDAVRDQLRLKLAYFFYRKQTPTTGSATAVGAASAEQPSEGTD
jgi:hypothetical protein